MKLCDELNAMCTRFWWGRCGDEKKIHWKSWEFLIQSKEGGNGFQRYSKFQCCYASEARVEDVE